MKSAHTPSPTSNAEIHLHEYRFPPYEQALGNFIQQVDTALLGLSPLLGGIDSRPTIHRGPFRNVPGPNPVDHHHTLVQASLRVNLEDIRFGRLESFLDSIYDYALRYQEEREKIAFNTLLEVTEAVGNSHSLEGRPLTAKDILDLIESVPVGFDEDGNPNKPTLFVGKDVASILPLIDWTEEDNRRLDQIRAKKKEVYLASKRTRRLGRPDHRT